MTAKAAAFHAVLYLTTIRAEAERTDITPYDFREWLLALTEGLSLPAIEEVS